MLSLFFVSIWVNLMSKRIHDTVIAQFSVVDRLMDLVSRIPGNHPMVGPLIEGRLCLPISDIDKRKLTWMKLVNAISEKIVNRPSCDMDCWFVAANHAGSKQVADKRDHITKLSADGSKNKWITSRLLYVLLHPEQYEEITDRSTQKLLCLHRCGKGKATAAQGPVCINPYHIKLNNQKQNRHDERCGHSCQALCPHKDELCIFTWADTGLMKPCFNNPMLLNTSACECEPRCSHVLTLL